MKLSRARLEEELDEVLGVLEGIEVPEAPETDAAVAVGVIVVVVWRGIVFGKFGYYAEKSRNVGLDGCMFAQRQGERTLF